MRTRILLVLTLLAASALFVVWRGSGGPGPAPVPAVPVSARGDLGDERAVTTFDGAMVRKRAAIAIHPAPGADRARITREMRSIARTAKLGPLEPATFAVFDEELLGYLVPAMTFVAPEGVPVTAAEAAMRDHQPADVAFYLVRQVVVHDVTFALVSRSAAKVAAAADQEGILTDVLGRYRAGVQRSGLTVRYFGAVLSDESIAAVRDALGRAAGLPADRVQVSANLPGPGVDLSNGVRLDDDVKSHGHG